MKPRLEQEPKINKKVQYAIRMLIWHSDLSKRYLEYIKNWLNTHHLDYDIDLMQFLKQKEKTKESLLQTTIYDFIEK